MKVIQCDICNEVFKYPIKGISKTVNVEKDVYIDIDITFMRGNDYVRYSADVCLNCHTKYSKVVFDNL